MTRDKHPDEMSEAELAEYHWQHRDDELGEEVDFDVSKPLRVTMSFRLPADEADVIREAAAAAGTSLSEWIRWAAMRAAHETDVPPPGMQQSPALENCCSRQSTSWAACSGTDVDRVELAQVIGQMRQVRRKLIDPAHPREAWDGEVSHTLLRYN